MIRTYSPEAGVGAPCFHSWVKTKAAYFAFRASRLREQGHVCWFHHIDGHVARHLDTASHIRRPEYLEEQDRNGFLPRELHTTSSAQFSLRTWNVARCTAHRQVECDPMGEDAVACE